MSRCVLLRFLLLMETITTYIVFFLQCSNRYAPVFWCASLAPFPSNEAGVNVEVELLTQVRHISGQGVQVHHHGIPASRHDNTQDLSWRHLCRQRLQLVVKGLQWALFASFDTLSDCQGGVTSSTWGKFHFPGVPPGDNCFGCRNVKRVVQR